MFKTFYYYVFAKVYYCIGDIVCRINAEWAGDLYQHCMKKSLQYDEKIGFKIWKEV